MPADIGSLVQLRLLVVEDENIVAKDIEQTLKAGGHSVCGIASTGLQAIEMAEATRPDVILMDIRLHGDVDGIEAARQIRERLGIPVVFLTAYADQRTLERAAVAEPYGYLLKPFDEKELHVTVMIAACKHRAFAELDDRVRERTEAIARSEARYHRIEAVAQLGVFALATRDIDAVIERAIDTVVDTLGTDLVELAEVVPDGSRLVLRAGRGWTPGTVGSTGIGLERDSQAGYTLLSAEPVVVADLAAEVRFTPSPLLVDQRVVSGLSVVVHAPGADGATCGVLGAHIRSRRHFSDADVHFLQAVANVIATALIRTSSEEQVRAADRMDAERARVVEAERAARAVAEAANRSKDEFLAMLAHELRNPLGAIRSAVAVLDRVGKHDDQAAHWREVIARQVTNLGRMVDDLLDASRAVTGKIVLDRAPVDLAAVVHRQLHTLRNTGCLEGHVVAVESRSAWVDADAVRMEQVIGNLLLNAVKYTPDNGRISVTVGPEHGQAVLRIEDSGIGIPPALLPRIFDLFVQGARSIDRAQGGLGVGLTLVRRLVEMHGGTVKASSEGEGSGSAFTVRLPEIPARPVPAPVADVAPAVRACRVLVVEDNRDARETLRELLLLWGHHVHDAEDGRTALETAARWKPDVALIDIGLPGIDGYEVCRRLRSSDAGRATRLVAITGYGQVADQARSTSAGFDAHLVKPVDPDDLMRVLADLT